MCRGFEPKTLIIAKLPRLKPDRNYSDKLAYFPSITGREIVPVDTSVLKKKRPWKVRLRNMRASGQNSFWIFNIKGSGAGTAMADLNIETRGGPLAWTPGTLT